MKRCYACGHKPDTVLHYKCSEGHQFSELELLADEA